MQIITTERVPIKIWSDDPEASAVEQLKMVNQKDLVKVIHTLKQFLCVKG